MKQKLNRKDIINNAYSVSQQVEDCTRRGVVLAHTAHAALQLRSRKNSLRIEAVLLLRDYTDYQSEYVVPIHKHRCYYNKTNSNKSLNRLFLKDSLGELIAKDPAANAQNL